MPSPQLVSTAKLARHLLTPVSSADWVFVLRAVIMGSNGDERFQPQQKSHQLDPVAEAVAETDAKNRCCVICLDDLGEPCEARPCQHDDFDFLCLVTWLETEPSCPLCKTGVLEVRYDLGEKKGNGRVHMIPQRSSGRINEGPHRADSPSRRQGNSRPRPPAHSHPFESEAVRRRRLIYRHKLYSLHVGFNTRQPANQRYKELSPQLFASDRELVFRARTWLRRELRVFRFLYTQDHGDHELARGQQPCKAEHLLEYIIAILKSMDMQGSTGQAENLIADSLGRDNTRLLLHELRAWLRSPCKSLSEWDGAVRYRDENVLRRVSHERGEDISQGQRLTS